MGKLMGTLGLYVSRLMLSRFLVIFIAVAGFAMLLDLLDVGTRVLQRNEGSYAALAWYALVRLPTLVTDLLPITALVASLVTVFDLFRHRELFIIWSAGVSRSGLMLRLLPVALLLAGLKLAVDDVAIPRSTPILRELGVTDVLGPVGRAAGWTWLRSGEDIIRVRDTVSAAAGLQDILIFHRDAQGRLVERIEAARAVLVPGSWQLFEVVRRPASARPPERLAELSWPVRVDASKLELMGRSPRELPLVDLAEVLANEGFGVAPTDGHRTWLHGRLAGAVTVVAMALMGVALVRGSARRSIALPLFGVGIAIGFAAMLAQGVLLAIGEVGLLWPEATAWMVPLALGVILILAMRPGWASPQGRASTAPLADRSGALSRRA